MSKKKFAGGFESIRSSISYLKNEKSFSRGFKALLKINQPKGFDCPGCAWPDPDKTSPAEFCENGVKAIAAETTTKKITANFFQDYSVSELYDKSDYWLEQQGRLTSPMYLPIGATHYQPISWSALFEKIGKKLVSLTSPNEAVFYTSGRTSNEAAFLYQLLGRELGTNNFPDCSNLCHESSGVALKEAIGIGKGTVSLEDFEKAEAIFVMGQNPATNHPRMLSDLQKAAKRGAKIVVVNPLKEMGLQNFVHPQDVLNVALGKATSICSLYLQPIIGGDMAFLKGVMKVVIEQELISGEQLDHQFLVAHTTGFYDLKNNIEQLSWDEICNHSGLTKQEIKAAAEIYCNAKATIICWAMGLTQHLHAVATIQDVVNLLLLKGNIGKEGAGVCPVRGHSNVQGDRTMGIHEKPPQAFLDQLERVFEFKPPHEHGYDSVSAIKAMDAGKVKLFMGMGGNYVSAMSDTQFTEQAMRKVEMTLHVSTKLNRSHLVTGKEAFILPCLGRTEIDIQNKKVQKVTVEDSMSMVHASSGILTPISDELLSEPYILSQIAKYALPTSNTPWEQLGEDYEFTREHIAKVVTGFQAYNDKIKPKGGFYLQNPASVRRWDTNTGKANFLLSTLPDFTNNNASYRLMTIRSHDQYNTTVYGLNDRYRGVANTRMVVFMHPEDIQKEGLLVGDVVTLNTIWHDNEKRQVSGFEVRSFDIAKGCLAAYFPETNVLVPRDAVAEKSNTPMSKFVPVSIIKCE